MICKNLDAIPNRGDAGVEKVDDGALLVALLDAAVDAIIMSDQTGVILRTNQAAADLFRHPRDSMIGQNVSFLMPAAMAARHDGFIHHHLQTGEKRIIGIGRDVEGLRGDGGVFPLHLSVGKAEIGGVVTFVAILHDLTRRRAAEDALVRSQRMDAIGRMTGGIAHDFNNLLTVVIGNLELLDMAETSARSRALITDALGAAELGADLTSRLMAFSRKDPLRSETINLRDAVERSMALLTRTIVAHCRIETAMAANLRQVRTDPTQLQTAILNLALNAQDAMPGGGRMILEASNVLIDDSYLAQDTNVAPGRYVRLSLSDSGEGMTPQARDRALEPFFSTKPAGKGTGLGLSMVYGFVRQSGGHLTIYSELGRGTTVSLYFPAIGGGAEDDDPADLTPPQNLVSGSRRLVLVVEDDPAVRRLSEARITELGFICIGASSAQEAAGIIKGRDDITLLFTDLVMPGTVSGYDLAKRVAAEHPRIRILLTSGFSEGMLRDGRLGPEFAILHKPYRQAELAKAIRAVLGED
jgi:PAS domain S-box-containing protein